MRYTFEQLYAALPHRECIVPGFGLILVPRHIVRIDTKNTHGWQVRYRGVTKFFSDGIPRAVSAALASLEAAKRFLHGVYDGPHIARITTETSRKAIRTGIPGVRLVGTLRPNRRVMEFYAEATPFRSDDAAKRFYIGTERTLTAERLDEAIEKASKVRERMRQEHLTRLRDEFSKPQ